MTLLSAAVLTAHFSPCAIWSSFLPGLILWRSLKVNSHWPTIAHLYWTHFLIGYEQNREHCITFFLNINRKKRKYMWMLKHITQGMFLRKPTFVIVERLPKSCCLIPIKGLLTAMESAELPCLRHCLWSGTSVHFTGMACIFDCGDCGFVFRIPPSFKWTHWQEDPENIGILGMLLWTFCHDHQE